MKKTKGFEPGLLGTAGRIVLRQRRVNAAGIKNTTAGLATEVVRESLVDRRTDRRTCRTACGTAEQAAEDRTSEDTQRMTRALRASLGERG